MVSRFTWIPQADADRIAAEVKSDPVWSRTADVALREINQTVASRHPADGGGDAGGGAKAGTRASTNSCVPGTPAAPGAAT